MRIFREKPGVIGPRACWVAIDRPWLYMADTLPGLLWQILTQWRHDRHMVG